MKECISCGTTKVSLYDDRFDVFACDEECLLEYILYENAYAMFEIYKEFNVVEINNEDD